jgi:hypothetical protein
MGFDQQGERVRDLPGFCRRSAVKVGEDEQVRNLLRSVTADAGDNLVSGDEFSVVRAIEAVAGDAQAVVNAVDQGL